MHTFFISLPLMLFAELFSHVLYMTLTSHNHITLKIYLFIYLLYLKLKNVKIAVSQFVHEGECSGRNDFLTCLIFNSCIYYILNL